MTSLSQFSTRTSGSPVTARSTSTTAESVCQSFAYQPRHHHENSSPASLAIARKKSAGLGA